MSCLEWSSPLSGSCGTRAWGKAGRDGNAEDGTNPLLSLQAPIPSFMQNSSPGTVEVQGPSWGFAEFLMGVSASARLCTLGQVFSICAHRGVLTSRSTLALSTQQGAPASFS